MKLAIVFDGLQIGGIERVGIDYIRIFRNLGHDVTVFNLRPELKAMECSIDDSVRCARTNFPRWLSPERYAAILKKAWWGKYIYPIAYIITKLLNILYKPLLVIRNKYLRESYDISIAFSGHINDLTFVADSYIKAKYKIAWLHGALYGYVIISPSFLLLYKKIKNLVSLSNMCDTEFFRFFRENSINKKRIYNPIYIAECEIDTHLVEQLKSKYGDFCLMVARFADDKDQKTAIDAVCILNKKYHFNKKLLLVGDGKNKKQLEIYVKKKKMSDNIIFMGSRLDVQNFYSAASVYVHSSPLEGLPTVLLEAMTYHLPIAATDSIPGVPEILQNNKCGLISEVFDAEMLADNIYKIYTDKELSNNLIANGTKKLNEFSPEFVQQQIEHFFNNLV